MRKIHVLVPATKTLGILKKSKPSKQVKIGRFDPSKLTYFDYVTHFRASLENDIDILRQINRVISPSIMHYYSSQQNRIIAGAKKLSSRSKKEYEAYRNFVIKGETGTFDITNKSTYALIEALDSTGMYSKRVPMFVREMSLVYLVVSFEDFLTSILKSTLVRNPRILKQSDKKLDYKQIVDHSSFDSLLSAIVSTEITHLFYKDIEEISDYIAHRFNLRLSESADWSKFKEIFYRRNLVIHNNCYPNDIYIKKTGYTGEDTRLTITDDYLSQSFDIFESYAMKITRHFLRKFHKKNKVTKQILETK